MQPQAPRPHRSLRAAATLVAALALMSASLVVGAAATAQAAKQKSAPQLSIAIANAETSVSVGDPLSYTITVKNLGSTAVRGLRVTQTMPPGLEFKSADAKGVAGKAQVRWKVDLKASGTSRLHSAMKVSKTPKQVLRLASVACGIAAGGKAPIVCATNSARLPAGAAAEAAAAVQAGAGAPSSGPRSWIGGLIGVAVVAAGAGVFLVRRRRAGPVGE